MIETSEYIESNQPPENYKPYPGDFTKIYVNGNLYPRHVVCAANRFDHNGEKLVICGARHWDSIMSKVVDAIGIDDRKESEQGFIDQYQNFITRKEACIIALTNNQPLCEPLRPNDIAFSENFY